MNTKTHSRNWSRIQLSEQRATRTAMLLLLLLLTLPCAVQAQFTYTTNNGTITITAIYTGPGGDVTIPDAINGLPVTSIGNFAFSDCTGLTSVTIPSSVTNIGDWAFNGCTSLTGVYFRGNAPSLGSDVFYGDSNAFVYYLPGTTGWGWGFGGLPAMLWYGPQPYTYTVTNGTITITGYNGSGGAVTIPSTINGLLITSIGESAFEYCTSLTSVIIPNTVTSVRYAAFWWCQNLESVTIPNSVNTIGQQAFYDCTSLSSVTIPDSVTSIGDYAFDCCTNLTGVYFRGNAPSADSTVFYGDNATVYYLPGTTGWGSAFGGRPTALWFLPNPLILSGSSFGVKTNLFGFIISWATNTSVLVEACTDLANPLWSPVGTNTLTNGSIYFSDPQWTNNPTRFYRLRSP